MKKRDEFNLLVRAGDLKNSYEMLKKEIEIIQHPEELLPKSTVIELKKEKNFKKAIKELTITRKMSV